ncbi:MAG: hypothetical protein ACRDVL_11730, partial [Acidimicrobiia bacterium]
MEMMSSGKPDRGDLDLFVAPGTAPTPFSADEMRRGCPSGRTVTVKVRDGQGPDRLETTRFVSTDDHGAVLER